MKVQHIFILCMVVSSNIYIQTSAYSAEDALFKHLLDNCSRSTRPVHRQDTTINVTFNIWLMQILEVDERNQKMTMKASYEMRWRNEICQWDPQQWHGIDVMYMKPSDVWIPDLTLYNNVEIQKDFILKGTEHVHFFANGSNMWYPQVIVACTAYLDITHFPFDLQTFEFKFGSWTLNKRKLNIITNNDPTIDPTFNSSEWTVLKQKKTIREIHYDGYQHPYVEIRFSYEFLRNSLFYIVTGILPCVILMMINLFSYFLPPTSGERMGVVVSILLAFSVFLELVSESLPRNSQSTSILCIFHLLSMTSCSVSFITACFVMTLYKRSEDGDKPPPTWIRKHVLGLSMDRLMMNSRSELFRRFSFQNYELQRDVIEEEYAGEQNNNGVVKVCQPFPTTRRGRKKRTCMQKRRKSFDLNAIVHNLKVMNMSLKKQNDSLSLITSTIKKRDEVDDIATEWITLAQWLDRFAFWLFVGMCALSFGVLFKGYKIHN